MMRPYAVASPVAWLISIRSASRRDVPRLTSALPVATIRLSGPIDSTRSATIETSPDSVVTVTGWARPMEGTTSAATHASRTIEARAGVIRGPSVPSRAEAHAVAPLVERARPVAVFEVAEDIADQR